MESMSRGRGYGGLQAHLAPPLGTHVNKDQDQLLACPEGIHPRNGAWFSADRSSPDLHGKGEGHELYAVGTWLAHVF